MIKPQQKMIYLQGYIIFITVLLKYFRTFMNFLFGFSFFLYFLFFFKRMIKISLSPLKVVLPDFKI